MADIPMCSQTLCPNAKHCYRIQAKASDWQSVMTYQYSISPRGVACENYMPMYRMMASDSSTHNVERNQPADGLPPEGPVDGRVGPQSEDKERT